MRKSGILLHISSLPSPYGIGSLGKEAYRFIDFLSESGMAYWQMLPICPTSYGDSPYQSYSTFAGNPYFIDLEMLQEEGLLRADECGGEKEPYQERVDYGRLYALRYPLLKKAMSRFEPDFAYFDFLSRNADWLEDYALFMALKEHHEGRSWFDWESGYRNREEEALSEFTSVHGEEIDFWKKLQFYFFRHWDALKSYASSRGISIIGDLPIYVALDSVDVWAKPSLFQLDENRLPLEVAGCPPDYFSKSGQLWGNPLYDWEYMERDDYAWWSRRIEYLCKVYDILRIDHFRGFDSYYAIPFGARDASLGIWKDGPGMKLFQAIEKRIGKPRIIAEDLGFLTPGVRSLLKESGFAGMKVLQSGFDSNDNDCADYLPHNFIRHCVAYCGTHDHNTIRGWFGQLKECDRQYALEYLRIRDIDSLHWELICVLLSSVAELTIIQAQDLFGLGKEARMNTPATVGRNWTWRAKPGDFDRTLSEKLRHLLEIYKRL